MCKKCRIEAGDYSGRHAGTDPDVDEVVVDRLLAGVSMPDATRAERREAVLRLERFGLSASQIAHRVGVTPRSVTRYRARRRVTV